MTKRQLIDALERLETVPDDTEVIVSTARTSETGLYSPGSVVDYDGFLWLNSSPDADPVDRTTPKS